jgi:DNA-binding MarR family transcriptional regulator
LEGEDRLPPSKQRGANEGSDNEPFGTSPSDPLDWFELRDLSVAAERSGRSLAAGYDRVAGLNLAEGRVLLVLAAFPSISAGEVTARTTMDKARVSRALSKLMLMGLVNRKAHRDDRRQAVLRVTAKGQRTAAEIESVARAIQADLLDVLTERERRDLRRFLQRIRDRADVGLGRETSRAERPSRPARAALA